MLTPLTQICVSIDNESWGSRWGVIFKYMCVWLHVLAECGSSQSDVPVRVSVFW